VEETRITTQPMADAKPTDFKPLYERLQEMKDQKDAEWNEKNNPFGISLVSYRAHIYIHHFYCSTTKGIRR